VIADEGEDVDEDDDEDDSEIEAVEIPELFGEMTVTTAQAAAWLRSVADAIEEGELESEPEDVGVPRKLTYKLELEQEHEGDLASLKFEIDVEIAWRFLDNDNED
jgi:amphi-Trp domain-containing protein